jgi:hypothetical protein
MISPIINGFSAGELSRDMDGRTDHEKYYSGCRRLENFISRPHGSVVRRPGLRFIRAAKHPDRPARLISFDFNSDASQSYVLEMGDQYLRVFKDGGIILDGEGEPYEIAAPWSADEIFEVRFEQTNDEVYFVHKRHAPQKLIRRGHDDWELQPLDFRIEGHDLLIVDGSGDGRKSGRQNDTFVLPAGRTFDEKMIVKGETPSGQVRWFEYHGFGFWEAKDSAITLTFKDADPPDWDANQIESIYDSSNKLRDKYWAVLQSDDSKPSNWKDGNWPGLVAFFEGRLFLAATPDRPLTFWASRVEKYNDFRMNTNNDTGDNRGKPYDDDAIEKTLSGSRMNPLNWFVDQEELLFGTNASEGRIWSGAENEPLTPANCQARRQTAYGSGNVPARLVADGVLFVSRSGRQVREMLWDINTYKYQSPELTVLARHVTASGIRDMDYAREPSGVLWAACGDGTLAGCTYLRDQKVMAWHRHPIGGSGHVESVAVIPGERGDELWALVRREIGGQVRRYVERMDPEFEGEGSGATDAREAFFVDCGLSYHGEPKAEISGLEHLEGMEVQILADGSVQAPQVVEDGKITLKKAAQIVHAGLGYRSVLQPMRFEPQQPHGQTMQTKQKRVMRVAVRFLDTVGGKVRAGDDAAGATYERILPHTRHAKPGTAPRLMNGDVAKDLAGEFETDGLLTIVQEDPLPMTVACCVPEVIPGAS